MKNDIQEPTQEEIDRMHARLAKDAKQEGYYLNPDIDFVKGLINGLIVNERRYGYQACPCRLAADDRSEDLDIICPCNYRDADITESGACYCALYVSKSVIEGKRELSSIPERRPPLEERQKLQSPGSSAAILGQKLSVPVWRCVVCGYLCGRDAPPEVCPICKAGKERFERFI